MEDQIISAAEQASSLLQFLLSAGGHFGVSKVSGVVLKQTVGFFSRPQNQAFKAIKGNPEFGQILQDVDAKIYTLDKRFIAELIQVNMNLDNCLDLYKKLVYSRYPQGNKPDKKLLHACCKQYLDTLKHELRRKLDPGVHLAMQTDELEKQSAVLHRQTADLQYLRQAVTASLDERKKEVGFPLHNLLFNRNPNFTGREDILEKLHEQLNKGETTAIVEPQPIAGLGGVGKTQIALEYAYRHLDDYDIVWWITSETEAALTADLVNLALALGVAAPDTPQPQTLQALFAVLSIKDKWLLIYDNVNEPGEVKRYLPKTGKGKVIITSRWRNWTGTAQALEVKTWPRPEAVAFVQKRMAGTSDEDANRLADALGDLPLALEQACAYIINSAISIENYLSQFDKCCPDLLTQDAPDEHKETAAKVFTLSVAKVEQESPAAVQLLKLCAFFAPEEIPLSGIRAMAEYLPEPLQTSAVDDSQWTSLRKALLKYSLVDIAGDLLSLHRLAHVVIRETMPDDEKQQFAATAVKVILDLLPEHPSDVRTWTAVRLLYSHALVVAGWCEIYNIEKSYLVAIYNQLAAYHFGNSEYREMQYFMEKALLIIDKAPINDYIQTATLVMNLAQAQTQMGNYLEAKENNKQAQLLIEKSGNKNTPIYASALNNYGLLLRAMGNYSEAKECLLTSLEIRQKTLGKDHSETAQSLNNVGEVLQLMGDFPGAKEKHEQGLKIIREKLGEDHPHTAVCYGNLGKCWHRLSQMDKALRCYQRANKICEKAVGADHLYTAISLHDLGALYTDLGKDALAREMFEKALKILEEKLGPNHSETLNTRMHLEYLRRDKNSSD